VVSKDTKEEGISMALSGLGSDELFAGYHYYKRMYYLDKFKNLANNTTASRMALYKIFNNLKETVPGNKIKELLQLKRWDIPYTYPLMRQVLNDSTIQQLLHNENLSPNRVQLMLENDEALKNGRLPVLSKISVAEISSYLQNILLRDTDQMSMAHALEVRVPFLDFNLVDYVLQIPDNVKFPSTPKRILVESLKGMLPDEIINRPKMGFVFPWERWMKNELRSYCEKNIRILQDFDFLDAATLDHLWKQFLSGDKAVSWSRVWILVVLGNWLKKNNVTI
jgi:asparagine synthase (glutamine-hydrolysing)